MLYLLFIPYGEMHCTSRPDILTNIDVRVREPSGRVGWVTAWLRRGVGEGRGIRTRTIGFSTGKLWFRTPPRLKAAGEVIFFRGWRLARRPTRSGAGSVFRT